jgi:hypothetical protein
VAGILCVVLDIVAVIVTEFFACLYTPQGDNPDRVGGRINFAVRITGVIDITGEVGERLPIDVIALIQFKDVSVPSRGSLGTFGFGNLFTCISNNTGAFPDLLSRKESLPVNARWANTNHISPLLYQAYMLFPFPPRPEHNPSAARRQAAYVLSTGSLI